MKIHMISITSFREAMRTSGEPHSAHIVADTYWRLLILSACVMVIGSFWYGYREFENVSSVGVELSSEGLTQPSADRAKITAVAEGLTARSESYNALKMESATATDPSL